MKERGALAISDISKAVEKLRALSVPPDAYGLYSFRAHPVAINGLFGLHGFKARRKVTRLRLFAAMEKQLADNGARYKAGKL